VSSGEFVLKIGIMGHGEIGSSVEAVYKKHSDHEIFIKDLVRDDGLENLDVLNICIPFVSSEQFIEAVCSQIAFSKPKVTIIHSTVLPGTTNVILDTTETAVVHSPVRGVHPNLYEGIMTFTKFIGADDEQSRTLAEEHLSSLGVKTESVSSSRASELGKLLSTTYYGVIIAWHGEMKKICDELGVKFEEAVSSFNETYNEGYEALGMSNVIRPTLFPPPNNKIGGHCVIPNSKLLDGITISDAIKLVLKYA